MTPFVLELLAWVAAASRSYAETMDAWRTSCPNMTVWEDATREGLVEVVRGDVRLTAAGRDALAAAVGPRGA